MKIKSVRVKNFRSIQDEILHCDMLTVLVGQNGSGKSSFLSAIELFQLKKPQIKDHDFYNQDKTKTIEISITFTELSNTAKEKFAKYIQSNELTIDRVFYYDEEIFQNKYHGSTLQNPRFDVVRNYTSAQNYKEKYNILKSELGYEELEGYTTIPNAKTALSKWEENHANKCIRRREQEQFFGYEPVSQGYLGQFVQILYIPAVRDASEDGEEGKGSVLTQLMDLVIRNSLEENEDIKKFTSETEKKYAELLDPTKLQELDRLNKEMTQTLQKLVPDSEIELNWKSRAQFKMDLPKAMANLIEDEYSSPIERAGHGLQRAFIMTILQHLSLVKSKHASITNNAEHPRLILIIEEPELYQHPNRQRHLSDVFLKLANGEITSVSNNMQLLYSTHSPHFVGLDRIDQLRLLRKIENEEKPKITKIFSTNTQKISEILTNMHSNQKIFSPENLIARLKTIMTPWMNEGFFAKHVILVEGEGDRAAILAMANVLQKDLEGKGIAIIPCLSKGNILGPAIIFQELGISPYIIWDSDRTTGDTGSKVLNKRFLNFLGKSEEDWPKYVGDTFACFENKLEDTLKEEIGSEKFNSLLEKYMDEFDFEKKSKAIKNPVILYNVISDAKKEGAVSETLEKIVQKIANH